MPDNTTTDVDHHPRRKTTTPIAEPVAAAMDEIGEFTSLLEHDDEWWAEHDRKVEREKKLVEDQERADAHRRRALMLKTDEHRFPHIAVDAALKTWPAITPAMAQAVRYGKAPQLLLVLAGGVGTGKSSAATWCALELGGASPAFIRASELEARGRYDKDLRTWLRTRSMLVLDDLGAEVLDGRGVFRSLLDEVVDMFYGDRKRLVVTTNLRMRCEGGEPPQLFERYGDRVTSRLAEVGLWGDCGGIDLRRGVR